MSANYNLALNRFFTQNTFKQILSKNDDSEVYNTVITRFVNNPYSKNYNQIFSEIYRHMKHNYRNEYFYKNTLINKLLLGIHKPTTTTALSEVPISKSKADFVLINGKAVVYEIKTELDTFDRLENQLTDYYKAFNHASVLTTVSYQKIIEEKLKGTPVGICLLTTENTIREIKKPLRFDDALDPKVIFKVLNKEEFESIIMNYYGYLPSVTPVKYYSECRKLFCEIDLCISYPLYLKELKKRNRIKIEEFNHIPYELKSLIYFSKYRKEDYQQLNCFLNRKFGG